MCDSDPALGWGPEPIEDLLRFSHEAMATTFEVFVRHAKPAYARQAAHEAFGLLDRLEQQLSRFLDQSDISRINISRPDESVLVGPETFECLRQARAAYELTGGAFDVTVGAYVPRRDPGPTVQSPKASMDLVRLDNQAMTVTRLHEGVQLDLGAIGKGFALDLMAQSLDEWGIRIALLHGGASTALAVEPPQGFKGWPVTISCPFDSHGQLAAIELRLAALSGSAQVRRPHIVDPRTGLYPSAQPATWSYARTAALADALSTAFVVMDPAAVADLCAKDPSIGALVVTRGPAGDPPACQARSYGDWLGGGSPVLCRCPDPAGYRRS
jgi:thiamine biosynthesis lipoprotein